MRIVVVTSCTGEKAVTDKRALTLRDFRKGKEHVKAREGKLASLMTPAEELYTGQQHVRLMRGVKAFREKHPKKDSDSTLDLHIVSAGYGLVPGRRKLAPYEATFQGMKKGELRDWADELGVATALRRVLTKPYDLALVLLGDSYLDACALDGAMKLGGPTLLFCGTRQAQKLPRIADLRAIPMSNPEASRFSCGLIGLKGELATRLLGLVTQEPDVIQKLRDPATDVLARLDTESPLPTTKRSSAIANPAVDYVVDVPRSWLKASQKRKLRYFIPEWDDLVDPDYDFENDIHSGGSGDWSNQVYAHQMYQAPSYDGILISKIVAEKSKKKKARINAMGVHRFLRIPRNVSVMGDCGAFGYIKEDIPPYETQEIIDYYTRLDFDYGVSIDHLIVNATDTDRRNRYELTIDNAYAFLKEHKARGLDWVPIGAVQGWDAQTYAAAAKKCVAMGYRYIALGGLVRTKTPQILSIVNEVRKTIGSDTKLHLFGLGRLNAMADFARLGVSSVDHASFLRKAWLGSESNYFSPEGWYSAIRVPQTTGSFRAKQLVASGEVALADMQKLEATCLGGLREFDQSGSRKPPVGLVAALVEYDTLVAGSRSGTEARIRRTLEDQPWKRCGCAVCEDAGIEIVIFRGNNRNRRRGFHNTHVFYQVLGQSLERATAASYSPIQETLPLAESGSRA